MWTEPEAPKHVTDDVESAWFDVEMPPEAAPPEPPGGLRRLLALAVAILLVMTATLVGVALLMPAARTEALVVEVPGVPVVAARSPSPPSRSWTLPSLRSLTLVLPARHAVTPVSDVSLLAAVSRAPAAGGITPVMKRDAARRASSARVVAKAEADKAKTGKAKADKKAVRRSAQVKLLRQPWMAVTKPAKATPARTARAKPEPAHQRYDGHF